MGACEDNVCRDIPPPTGTGPWVLYWQANLNGNFPYWEELANLEPAPEGLRLKASVVTMRVAESSSCEKIVRYPDGKR